MRAVDVLSGVVLVGLAGTVLLTLVQRVDRLQSDISALRFPDAGLRVDLDAGPLFVEVPDAMTPELACRDFCAPHYGFVLTSMAAKTNQHISYFCDCRDDKGRSQWPMNAKGHLK